MSGAVLAGPAAAGPAVAGRRWTRDRVAVTVIFVLLGAVTAGWAARIPAVQGRLGLAPSTLGLVLLGPAAGSVLAMPLAGLVLAHLRPRPVIAAGLVPFIGLLPLVAVCRSAWALFAVLLGWGIGLGLIDVAMNVEAVAVTEAAGRPLMSGFHAGYSIGLLSGAGIGAAAAAGHVSVGWHLGLGAAVAALAGGVSVAVLPDRPPIHDPAVAAADRPAVRHLPELSWPLVALSVMALTAFLCEGAANDWSAVYLHVSLGASPAWAALGFTMYATAMAVGRLVGDRLTAAVGGRRLVTTATGLAAVVFLVALLLDREVAGFVGFALLGGGLAFTVPTVFVAASRLGSPGPSLALVTSCGYAGLLAGPPLIGLVAGAVGLPGALGVVVVAAATSALLARVLGRPA